MLKDKINIKPTLELKRTNKSKSPLVKKETVPKKRSDDSFKVFPSYHPIFTKEQAWMEFEITFQKELSKDDKAKRQQIFEFVFSQIGPTFHLMSRSLEHSIKLLDIFYGRCAEKKQSEPKANLYPEKVEILRDFMVSIFMTSKYNEVYPPILIDIMSFCQGGDQKVNAKSVLDKELTVFAALDYNMNVALVSDWWKIKYQKYMPLWAYWCYLAFDLKDTSKYIFQEILRFIQAVNKSSFKEVYQEFVKESDQNWNVKEGDKSRRRIYEKRCKDVYDAFCLFRKSGQINLKFASKDGKRSSGEGKEGAKREVSQGSSDRI